MRGTCAYARIFEPSGWEGGPSGLQDPPRPFVLRAGHLDGVTVKAGGSFSFDLHLFITKDPPLEYFVLAFSRLAETGLGPGRGRIHLESVDLIGADAPYRIFAQGRFVLRELPSPLEFPLQKESDNDIRTITIRFTTPLELKQDGQIATRPEFGLLITRIAERISNLCVMYGESLEWDWRGLVTRAQSVRLVAWRVTQIDATMRFSTKTGQRHRVGGWRGEARYEGVGLGEFLPLLEVAKHCGVGRHTVWGNGVLEVVRENQRQD